MKDGQGTMDNQAYSHYDPIIDQALDWAVVLKAGGEPSADTMQNFECWLRATPEHQKAWEEIARLWGLPEVMIASVASTKNVSRSAPPFAKTRRPGLRNASWRVGVFSAVTATILMLFGLAIYQPISIYMQADYRTEVGQLKDVILPDGSRMVLDTQSAVAVDFASVTRHVRLLKGEAWFDVVHDTSRPFRVSTGLSEVEVKGTAFSVATDSDTDTVMVERGRVHTKHKNSSIKPVDLREGEMLEVSSASISPIKNFDADSAFGWKQGRISIANVPLSDALGMIGRYYEGRIVLLNTALRDIAITGNYRIDNVDAAIDSVVTAAGGRTTHFPGGIIIIR